MKLCDKLYSTVEILQKHHDFSHSQLLLTNYFKKPYTVTTRTKGQNLKFTIRILGEAPLVIIFEIITENWEADKYIVTRNIRLQSSVKMKKNVK